MRIKGFVQAPQRRQFAFFLKLAIAFGLIGWLVRSGRIDVQQIAGLLNTPGLLLLTVCYWAISTIFLSGFRCYLLLRAVGVNVPYRRVLLFQWIGVFFNATMPAGAVGGDVVKGAYIVKCHGKESLTPALMALLFDRLLGLLGLFTIGVIAVTGSLPSLVSHPQLVVPSIVVYGVFAGMVAVFTLLSWKEGVKHPIVERLLDHDIFFARGLRRIHAAVSLYAGKRKTLAACWVLSMVIQLCYVSYLWRIAQALISENISFGIVGSLVPIGTALIAIPMTPGGLGIGHVAFDHLFALVGIDGGANLFNLLFVGQMVLNLSGIVPYLLVKPQSSSTSKQVTRNPEASLYD
jgi:uncharacterized protein (TIRG00374 family)